MSSARSSYQHTKFGMPKAGASYRHRDSGFQMTVRPGSTSARTIVASNQRYKKSYKKGKNQRSGGFTGVEKKFVDFTVTTTNFTLAWPGGELDPTNDSLCGIANGSGISQHEGSKYWIHSIFIQGEVETDPLESQPAPIGDTIARLALVWDTQTNGAQLNAEDVFDTFSSTNDWMSFKGLERTSRFKVLRDITIRLPVAIVAEGAANLFARGATLIPFNMYVKFRNPIKVRTSGTGATISDIADNSFHLIGTATTTGVHVLYRTRSRFTA